jgi:RNA polymerase sigma factor (sigma-70 family)
VSPSVSVRLLLTQSDARLVAFAQVGHERAFEALVQRHRRPLLGYCRRLLLSEERAEDALQQALLQAWLALRSGTAVDDFKPWLYKIVHNTALNALRSSGYDYAKLSESLTGAGAPQEDLDRRIAVREALAGLAALPPMQRDALLRTAVEGRTHHQVARELGLSESALRGLVYRARTSLRAAAGAIVPPPLLTWALGSGGRGMPLVERLGELVAGGGGSAGVAGLLLKGGAVAATAGMLAGGVAAVDTHPRRAHRHSASHSIRLTGLSPTEPVASTEADAVRVMSDAYPGHGLSPGDTHHPPQPRFRHKRIAGPSPMPSTTRIAPTPGSRQPSVDDNDPRYGRLEDGSGHDREQSTDSSKPGIETGATHDRDSRDGRDNGGDGNSGRDSDRDGAGTGTSVSGSGGRSGDSSGKDGMQNTDDGGSAQGKDGEPGGDGTQGGSSGIQSSSGDGPGGGSNQNGSADGHSGDNDQSGGGSPGEVAQQQAARDGSESRPGGTADGQDSSGGLPSKGTNDPSGGSQ